MTKEDVQNRSDNIHNNEYELIGKFKGINEKCITLHKLCGYQWEMNLNNHIYKGRGCPKCNNKIPLTVNEIQDLSDNIHDFEYLVIKTIRKKSKNFIILKHLICDHKFDVDTYKHLNQKSRCPKCFKKEKLSVDIIRNRIFDLYRNEYELLSKSYISIDKKLTIKHNKCGNIWDITGNNFLNKKNRCPKCFKPDKYTISSIQEKSDLFHNNEYEILSKEYINSNHKILISHKKCGFQWKVFILNHLNKKTGCPKCYSSKGEMEILNFLELNNIKYIREYKFEGCLSIKKYPLKFDFYCPLLNLCIEFDGEQHFRSIEHFGGNDKLIETKNNDLIKNEYCKDNDMKIIRIPYTKFNDINKILYEKIINN